MTSLHSQLLIQPLLPPHILFLNSPQSPKHHTYNQQSNTTVAPHHTQPPIQQHHYLAGPSFLCTRRRHNTAPPSITIQPLTVSVCVRHLTITQLLLASIPGHCCPLPTSSPARISNCRTSSQATATDHLQSLCSSLATSIPL
ncbi:hypothetical protein M0R45_015696 [Rubus argutus]|uniref:Uncharacterized protein n=1 Tax=Rubus argutus TaxID=59490 RepID=A0AAW1XQ05_RUBAR